MVLFLWYYRRYSRVRKWTLGLSGGKDLIAVIRASGAISRVKSPTSLPSSSGVIAEQIIEKIRVVRGEISLRAQKTVMRILGGICFFGVVMPKLCGCQLP